MTDNDNTAMAAESSEPGPTIKLISRTGDPYEL